ncbi:uroporphyrinogen-III synthase [Roseovarius sp. THAF9]|uniref:uroporphyrinogen-III synthase n=1 Tax=Roseovarius sp. THAF9 TaxID=2587847 RepID=UPI001269414F|nr:uroporphyrinogen-III synthase [Roseovarius sp. THAF9]QFT95131.1 uroporphyrinogen-III synthase [Roseovarius sp. THAF9]
MPALILITRPVDAAKAFAATVQAELGSGADICIAPILEIQLLPDLPDLAPFPTLIFTSAHAVASFARATSARGFTCYTVGRATAEKAMDCGLSPIVGPGTGLDLAKRIVRDAPATPCLHLRGDHVAFDIAKYLNSAGIDTDEATVYRQLSVPLPDAALTRIMQADAVIAPVFSPRSAQLLLDALPKGANLHVAAISDAAAGVFAPDDAVRIEVAQSPDRQSMLACTATLWSRANRLEGRSSPQ